jgi:hypothetical protein
MLLLFSLPLTINSLLFSIPDPLCTVNYQNQTINVLKELASHQNDFDSQLTEIETFLHMRPFPARKVEPLSIPLCRGMTIPTNTYIILNTTYFEKWKLIENNRKTWLRLSNIYDRLRTHPSLIQIE